MLISLTYICSIRIIRIHSHRSIDIGKIKPNQNVSAWDPILLLQDETVPPKFRDPYNRPGTSLIKLASKLSPERWEAP